MERLTTRVEDKVYYSKGEYPPTTLCAEMETHEIRECMKKLAEYEDTGLRPNEITSLKEQLDISRAEVQGLSKKLAELQFQAEVLADTVNMLSPLIMESYNLKKERDYWKREALKWASELGEQKIEGSKNERNKV